MRPARRRAWGNTALIAPLLLFLLAIFLLPVLAMLMRGLTEREIPAVLPQTARLLRHAPRALPDDAVARTFARELVAAHRVGTLSVVANRLNYDIVGSRSMVLDTAKALDHGRRVEALADLRTIDRRWGDTAIWSAVRHAARPVTSFYLWAALDRRVGTDDRVRQVSPNQRVFVDIYARTFEVSAWVTFFCMLLGYPVAYLLATLPARRANLLLIVVLLPFWTSALVRTTAWVVLLQTNGVINRLLQGLDIVDAPLALVYNRLGVYIAMTHILLPFFILPLYGVMRGISPLAVQAAQSLGARPLTAFRKVYLPQTLPGVAAGGAIVFALALGYYITPALVGGGGDQMISSSIAFYVDESLNWGMAAALSLLLLIPLLLVVLAGRAALSSNLAR